MAQTSSRLDPMFEPESVAFIGASDDASHFNSLYGNFDSLRRDIDHFFVNPNRETVFGERCYSSVTNVDATVDLAVIMVPAPYVVGVFEECCEADVRTAVIVSAGFKELDEAGREREERLAELSVEHDVPFCGPNSGGVVSLSGGLGASLAALPPLEVGPISIVSQSGALLSQLFRSGSERGHRFSKIIDSGNQATLSATEYIEYLIEDDETELIVLIAEEIDDPERFVKTAGLAGRRGIPLLVLKLGRSDRGKAAAREHTGAEPRPADEIASLFERTHAIEVDSLGSIVELVETFTKADPVDGPGVAFADISGGGTTLFADCIESSGLDLPRLEPATTETLGALLPPIGTDDNPVDTGIPWNYPNMDDDFPLLLNALAADQNVDIVVIRLNQVPNETGTPAYITDRFEQIEAANEDADAQFVVLTRPTYDLIGDWVEMVGESEVPVLHDYRDGIEAIDAFARYSARVGTE